MERSIDANNNSSVVSNTTSMTMTKFSLEYDYEEYFANNVKKLDLLDLQFVYKGYYFEHVSYLYIWPVIVIVTSILNALVVLVLAHRRMRNATNVILIALAITDTLTGLVMVPVFLLAYWPTNNVDLHFSKVWCETFMLMKYFVARSLHTMSIWLTVLLGAQRLVSVAFPFRANCLFSVHKTLIYIILLILLSPVMHLYHVFDTKTSTVGLCRWEMPRSGCAGGCVYIWLMTVLMHVAPSVILIALTVGMVAIMNKATQIMKKSRMIPNEEKINKRALESRRISAIVVTVVIVFLIPEVPHMIFLIVFMSRHHTDASTSLHTNRTVTCVYELLVICTFNANFWIYLAMNRKFRERLRLLSRAFVDPVYSLVRRIKTTHNFVQQPRFRESLPAASSGQMWSAPVDVIRRPRT